MHFSCCFKKSRCQNDFNLTLQLNHFPINQNCSFHLKSAFLFNIESDLIVFDIDFDFNYATKFSCQNLFSCTSDEK